MDGKRPKLSFRQIRTPRTIIVGNDYVVRQKEYNQKRKRFVTSKTRVQVVLGPYPFPPKDLKITVEVIEAAKESSRMIDLALSELSILPRKDGSWSKDKWLEGITNPSGRSK